MVMVDATSPGDGNSANPRGRSRRRRIVSAGRRLGAFLRRTTTPCRSNITTNSGSVTCFNIIYNSSARGDGGGIPSNVILLILIIVSLVIVLVNGIWDLGGGGRVSEGAFPRAVRYITGWYRSRALFQVAYFVCQPLHRLT